MKNKKLDRILEEVEKLREELRRKTISEPYPVPYPVYPQVPYYPQRIPWVQPYYPFWCVQAGGAGDVQQDRVTYTCS